MEMQEQTTGAGSLDIFKKTDHILLFVKHVLATTFAPSPAKPPKEDKARNPRFVSYFSEFRSPWLVKVPLATNRGRRRPRMSKKSEDIPEQAVATLNRTPFCVDIAKIDQAALDVVCGLAAEKVRPCLGWMPEP
jgi:hypothetical protein